MAELERLFTEFVERHLTGEDLDPWSYIDQLSGGERKELEELIDAYFVGAPPRSWNAAAYTGSSAERIADALDRSFRGQAGLWPAVLPRLRDRARLTRGALVERLADALGVGDRREKVAGYYHEMEQGLLPSAGVSSRVLEALAGIVGASAEALRRAGEPLSKEPSGEAEAAVFARRATPAPEYGSPGEALEAHDEDRAVEWDEVDELFRGGS
ncbi:MAG: hypothetical protein AABM66_09810 [Actinomycetota bacterium]